jgi:hypothetical protein
MTEAVPRVTYASQLGGRECREARLDYFRECAGMKTNGIFYGINLTSLGNSVLSGDPGSRVLAEEHNLLSFSNTDPLDNYPVIQCFIEKNDAEFRNAARTFMRSELYKVGPTLETAKEFQEHFQHFTRLAWLKNLEQQKAVYNWELVTHKHDPPITTQDDLDKLWTSIKEVEQELDGTMFIVSAILCFEATKC